MSDFPSLVDFWRLKRQQEGTVCIVKPFHHKIAQALTKLMLGTLGKDNLMILMPPRMAKTDLGVKGFVPWAQSYFPDSEFILTSYASDLAVANAVDIRQTLSSEWYLSMIDSTWGANVLMVGEKAGGRQDYFHTLEGGSVKAVGMGGGITGFGAGKLREEFGGAIIIDDPLKAQDARSAAMRLSAIEYINKTLKSRKNNNRTPIILIMQRLHPSDPAGELLKEERDKWFVLEIPAQSEDGSSIWEDRISAKELDEMKEGQPDLYWSQYQQTPSESATTIFKESWWKYWYDLKEVEKRITLKIITADTAFKAKDSSDFSVLQCWGFEGSMGLYLLDQVKGRWEFPELMRQSSLFWEKHHIPINGVTPATEFWIEDKASGTSLIQMFRREARIPARPWLPKDPDRNYNQDINDKVSRANGCTMPISAGRVFVPYSKMEGYRWVDSFVNEHSGFTNDDSHLHDDQVDCHTMANLVWQRRGGGRGNIPTPFVQPISE